MKKLFALFMVVAMLSVAGSAMATSIIADNTDVTLTKGNTATVSVTGTASHGGTLAYSLVEGLATENEWASLSGTTVTLTSPSDSQTGYYTVIVRTTETYTETDEAGHTATKTDTADVQITVNVLTPVTPKPEGGSSTASSKTESVVVVTTEDVADVPVPDASKVTAVTTDEVKKPSANNTTITVNVTAYVTRLGGGSSATVVDKSDPNAVEFKASTKSHKENVNHKAAGMKKHVNKKNARLGPIIPDIIVKIAGLLGIDLKYGPEFVGSKPGFFLNPTGVKVASSFFASAEEDVIFLDSAGKETEVVPADGIVTAVVYVEPGVTYEPITYAEIPEANLTAFDDATGTTTQTVALVTESEVTATVNSTETFSPVVADERVRDAVSARYGKTVSELPYTAASTTLTWAASDDEKAYMTANKLEYVCSLPVLVLDNIADGAYIAAIKFDNTPSFTEVGAPAFYPDGVKASGKATSAKLYTYENGSATEITEANAADVVENGRAVYLVFEIAGGTVAVAEEGFEAAAVTLTKPAVVVADVSSSGGDTPGGDTPGGDTPGGDTPGGDTGDVGVGSSSGGCSAGSAVLAMAVLGAFIATRKK